MKIGFAQINSIVGDFKNNAQKILLSAQKLVSEGADFAIFPEGALSGLPL